MLLTSSYNIYTMTSPLSTIHHSFVNEDNPPSLVITAYSLAIISLDL